MNKKLRGTIEILLVLALLIIGSYYVGNNIEFFESFIGNNPKGVISYMLIEITSIVVAPVTTLPIIIIASNVFGWVNAGLYSWIGWVIGSLLAFAIARKYGVTIVKRFTAIEKFHDIEARVIKNDSFMWMVFLRIVIPMDILSYFLGLFSNISTRKYLATTIIGLAPLAFGLAYLGEASFLRQIQVITISAIIFLAIWSSKIIVKKVRQES